VPDEEGYLLPGELGGGGYGAIEGDLGEKLRPLAGFGREVAPVKPQEAFWDEDEEDPYVLPGGFSTGLPAAYTLRGWNA
jgi:hypothetical protein